MIRAMNDTTCCVALFALTVLPTSSTSAQEDGSSTRLLERLPALDAGMPIIDAHCHYAAEHPLMQKWLANNQVRILNIAVGRADIQWRAFGDRFQ